MRAVKERVHHQMHVGMAHVAAAAAAEALIAPSLLHWNDSFLLPPHPWMPSGDLNSFWSYEWCELEQ